MNLAQTFAYGEDGNLERHGAERPGVFSWMLPIMLRMASKLSAQSKARASAVVRSHPKRGVNHARIRGVILRHLSEKGERHRDAICSSLAKFGGRKMVTNSLWQLTQLGYLEQRGDRYAITEAGRAQARIR